MSYTRLKALRVELCGLLRTDVEIFLEAAFPLAAKLIEVLPLGHEGTSSLSQL